MPKGKIGGKKVTMPYVVGKTDKTPKAGDDKPEKKGFVPFKKKRK